MIRFITGRSGSGKSETVTREVCDLINNTEREVVVIVPEQETVVWERKFAGLLKPSSNLRLEVVLPIALSTTAREFSSCGARCSPCGTV